MLHIQSILAPHCCHAPIRIVIVPSEVDVDFGYMLERYMLMLIPTVLRSLRVLEMNLTLTILPSVVHDTAFDHFHPQTRSKDPNPLVKTGGLMLMMCLMKDPDPPVKTGGLVLMTCLMKDPDPPVKTGGLVLTTCLMKDPNPPVKTGGLVLTTCLMKDTDPPVKTGGLALMTCLMKTTIPPQEAHDCIIQLLMVRINGSK